MDDKIIFSLPDNTILANNLASKLNIEIGLTEIRSFPDEESYIRINSEVKDKIAILVCTLDHPNSKIMPLMFMAETIKELGAKKVCLVSPYLSYMRQDKRFNPGEANTSSLFAKLLSGWLDCLITIDPHLHRIKNLTEIYSIHSISVLHATKLIAEWINLNVDKPILIGPDEESAQWVSEIAASIHAPFVISNKVRSGDRNVSITVPPIKNLGNVPVLVDDIISTGESMIASLQQVLLQGFKNPICIGVHALFNNEVEKRLLLSGAEQIITCNTIPHLSNKIDITDMIVKGIIEVC